MTPRASGHVVVERSGIPSGAITDRRNITGRRAFSPGVCIDYPPRLFSSTRDLRPRARRRGRSFYCRTQARARARTHAPSREQRHRRTLRTHLPTSRHGNVRAERARCPRSYDERVFFPPRYSKSDSIDKRHVYARLWDEERDRERQREREREREIGRAQTTTQPAH